MLVSCRVRFLDLLMPRARTRARARRDGRGVSRVSVASPSTAPLPFDHSAAPAAEPIIRFETPAGRQAQVDSALSVCVGVRYALLAVLGYSRMLWCRFYPRQDMATLIDGLDEAFEYFGGVPQELLFD